MLRVLSLFSGIGAYEEALENLQIPYELLNYCEIDKYASKAYSLVHNVDESLNLWDIRNVDVSYLVDLLVHSSPCTNVSIAGKNEGAVKGSGTQSALIYESIRIIQKIKPKVIVYENVTNILSRKHFPVFKEYLDKLEEIGYNNTYQILNASDFGIAQSRKRVFIVSTLDRPFVFPSYKAIVSYLYDFIQDPVEIADKYYLKKEYVESFEAREFQIKENQIIKVGTITAIKGHDVLKRVYSKTGLAPTLTTGTGGNNIPKIIDHQESKQNISIRKLTPLEYFRLQGFREDDYNLLRQYNFSDSQMYKMIGNSIAVPCLEYIFNSLIKEGILNVSNSN